MGLTPCAAYDRLYAYSDIREITMTKYEVGDYVQWNAFEGEIVAIDDIATAELYDEGQPDGTFLINFPTHYPDMKIIIDA